MRLAVKTIVGVRQTRIGHPSGDCYRAAVATVLGYAIEDVPDIHYALDRWTSAGAEKPPEEVAEVARVSLEWARWFRGIGLMPICVERLSIPEEIEGGYGLVTIGTVESASGPWHHAVVCLDGEIVWDPNPADLSFGRPVLYHEMLVVVDPRGWPR